MNDLLYSEVKGHGKNIVLLHGWGMHGGLWGKFNDLLAENFQTHCIDLPGFGFSKNMKVSFNIDAISEAIEEYILKLVQPVILIGWSLGGLITLNIVKRNKVDLDKVVLIASTPAFTKKPGWDKAMQPLIFEQFADDLKTDYKKTLKRFLSLQTRGSDLARDNLRELNKKLLERGEPDSNALEKGLEILSHTDLRSLEKNSIAAMVLLGDKDTLVPVEIKTEFERMFTNLKKLIVEKAAHAPFISKPELCAETIKNFINE